MNRSEQAQALGRDLNDAVREAVLKPSPKNLREVSKLINALHATNEKAEREQLEENAP